MAKTLNQFLEGYLKVKNPDEQKFVNKHVVAKHSDRNGNGDEVFNGSKVKPIDRRKERHGYNPGEDEKVYEAKIDAGLEDELMSQRAGPDGAAHRAKKKLTGNQHKLDKNKNGKLDAHDFKLLRKEEAEQLDELSPDTLRRYTMKSKAIADNEGPLNYREKGRELAGRKKYGGRLAGVEKAKVMAKEETEELDEKLTAKTPMGTYIKDFQKSDAPQFKGKSKEKRRIMAIAAKLTAERGGKPLRKEEKLAKLIGDLTESHQRTIMTVFEKLNDENQKKFLEACETPEGVEHMLDFAIAHRGE